MSEPPKPEGHPEAELLFYEKGTLTAWVIPMRSDPASKEILLETDGNHFHTYLYAGTALDFADAIRNRLMGQKP